MEPDDVDRLERELETAIAQTLQRLGPRRLPHQPGPQIIHLMAKAATTVYEAVAEMNELND